MKGKLLPFILSVSMATGIFLMPQTAETSYAGGYPVSHGGSLPLNTPTDIDQPMGEVAESYVAYAFKTNNIKGYYYSVLNSTLPETNPNVHIATDGDTDTVFRTPNTSTYCEIGDFQGGENNLSADTVYYFLISRRADKPYKANVSIKFLQDNEADTSSQASDYRLGSTISGSIDGAKDIDVWKFTTADDEYTLSAKAESNTVDLYIYKDADLTSYLVDKSVTKDGFSTNLTKLEKYSTYYIALKCAANHMTGKRHNYSFTITGKNIPENNSEKQKQEEQEKNNENGKNQEANQEEKAQETNKDSSENKDKTTDKTTVKKSISKAQIIGIKDKTYTGKAISQNLTVKLGGRKLKAGTDYTVKYKNNKNAGKATITITGKGKYKGTATARFKIKKAANSLNVKAKKKTYFFTYSKLLKRDYKIKESLIYKISKKGQGSLSYTLSSAMTGKKNVKSRFAVDKKTGKITVKKKITKGTYKLTINVTAAGDKNHNKSTKKISVSVKVR